MDVWLSSRKMTVLVTVEDGIIVKSAPIVWKFVGQPLENLVRWMKRQGGFWMKELEDALLRIWLLG